MVPTLNGVRKLVQALVAQGRLIRLGPALTATPRCSGLALLVDLLVNRVSDGRYSPVLTLWMALSSRLQCQCRSVLEQELTRELTGSAHEPQHILPIPNGTPHNRNRRSAYSKLCWPLLCLSRPSRRHHRLNRAFAILWPFLTHSSCSDWLGQ